MLNYRALDSLKEGKRMVEAKYPIVQHEVSEIFRFVLYNRNKKACMQFCKLNRTTRLVQRKNLKRNPKAKFDKVWRYLHRNGRRPGYSI